MTRLSTELSDVRLFELRAFGDERGLFFELNRARGPLFQELGVTFVQDNASRSKRGVLRGMHAQDPRPQGKLVTCLDGAIWDVVVDARDGSPDYGKWEGFELTSDNVRQLYVPPGFLHGFLVLSDEAIVTYKVTMEYFAEGDLSVRYDDPDLAIDWPTRVDEALLSEKDRGAKSFRDVAPLAVS